MFIITTNILQLVLTVIVTSGWWAWALFTLPLDRVDHPGVTMLALGLMILSAALIFWSVTTDLDTRKDIRRKLRD